MHAEGGEKTSVSAPPSDKSFGTTIFAIFYHICKPIRGITADDSLGEAEHLLRGPQKKPTVGRRDDPQWVAVTTYSRFFRRPTVGSFLTLREVALGAGSLALLFSPYEARPFTPGFPPLRLGGLFAIFIWLKHLLTRSDK